MKRFFLLAAILLISNLTIAQIAATANEVCPILVGQTIPDISLTNTDNKHTSIQSIVNDQPTILIFYRGGWCPYCNAHLSDIGKVEEDILKAGYQIIAISPDEPAQLQNTIDKKELKYTLLSDADGSFTKAMGIAFKAPDKKWKSNQLQKYSGGKNDGFLPVPSIFILNKKGEILFEYVNPKYSQRMSGATLLAIIQNL